MLTVIVGLAGALVFGAADFLGGMAARRIDPIRVTAISAAVGMFVLLGVLGVTGGVWSASAVLLGAVSGVCGAIAIALLYACLAVGPMSILSPLTAIVSATVPMTAGLLRGERLSEVGYAAIGIALIAVVLVGFVPDREAVRPTLRSVLMAIGSGLFIGAFLIIIDLTPPESGPIPLVFNRLVDAIVMFAAVGAIAVARRRRPRSAETERSGWRRGLLLALVGGVADAAGNGLLLLGLRLGDLTVISVLTALYPAGTIILAALVLRERITLLQAGGLVLAVAAGAMLALA